MRLRTESALALLAFIVVGMGAASTVVPARAAADNSGRCNYIVAGTLERRIRSDAEQRAGTNVDALNAREQELDDILQDAQVEDGVLQSVCSPQALAGPEDQLYGVMAWAYVLQATIATQRFTLLHCPQAASTTPAALVSAAWYAAATTLVDPNRPVTMPAPTPAPLVKEVIPKVQAEAHALGLDLPAPAEATEYWRNAQLAKAVPCTPASP